MSDLSLVDGFWKVAPALGGGIAVVLFLAATVTSVFLRRYRVLIKAIERAEPADIPRLLQPELPHPDKLLEGTSPEDRVSVARQMLEQRAEKSRARLVLFVIGIMLFAILALLALLLPKNTNGPPPPIDTAPTQPTPAPTPSTTGHFQLPPLKILVEARALHREADPALAIRQLQRQIEKWCDDWSTSLVPPSRCTALSAVGLSAPSIEMLPEPPPGQLPTALDDALVLSRNAVLGVGGLIELRQDPKTGEHEYYIVDASIVSNPNAIVPLPSMAIPDIRFRHPADNFWGAGSEVVLPLTITPVLFNAHNNENATHTFAPVLRAPIFDMAVQGEGPNGRFRSPPIQNLNRSDEPEFVAITDPAKARLAVTVPLVHDKIKLAALKPYIMSALVLRQVVLSTLQVYATDDGWRPHLPVKLGQCDLIKKFNSTPREGQSSAHVEQVVQPFSGWAKLFCAEMHAVALVEKVHSDADSCGCACLDPYPAHSYYSWVADDNWCPHCFENMAQLMYLVNDHNQLMNDLDVALKNATGRDAARLRHLRVKYVEMRVANRFLHHTASKDQRTFRTSNDRDIETILSELAAMGVSDPESTALAEFELARLRMFSYLALDYDAARIAIGKVLARRPKHALSRFLQARLLRKSSPRESILILEQLLHDLEETRGGFVDELHSLGPLDFVRYDVDPAFVLQDIASIVIDSGREDYAVEDLVQRAATRYGARGLHRLACSFANNIRLSTFPVLFPATFTHYENTPPVDANIAEELRMRGRGAVLKLASLSTEDASIQHGANLTDPAGRACPLDFVER